MTYKVVNMETIIINFIEKHSDEFCTRKRTGEWQPTVEDVWATTWGCMLKHRDIANSYSIQGKKLRQRFRIPYILFPDWLVHLCRENNIFGTASSHISIEFIILVALRILRKNNTEEYTNELCGGSIGESTCVQILKTFVTNMSTLLYDEWISEPEGEDLKKVM